MTLRMPFAITLLLTAPLASPAESMRCGSRLVADGDPKAKVADLCGQPTYKEQRTIYRTGIPRGRVEEGTSAASDDELLIHDRSIVEVDVWLYNRGRSRLMREVVFEDNRVIEVNVLGRGY